MFKTLKMSEGHENWEKDGFSTEDEAWKYIFDHFLCVFCREEVEKNDSHIGFTACGCEWNVEEY